MRIAVFMTYGASLAAWNKLGILERELALYAEYQKRGHQICLVSYGSLKDIELASSHNISQMLVNRWSLPTWLYQMLLPYLYRRQLSKVDVIKTNQLHGAHVAWRVAKIVEKPLIVRQGFSYYEFAVAAKGCNSFSSIRAKHYERRYLRKASLCLFTTEQEAQRVITRVQLPPDNVKVVPNYVVTERWSPRYIATSLQNRKAVIGYVGRLTEQKNPKALIHALIGLHARIEIFGDGPYRKELGQLSDNLCVMTTFHGTIKQSELVPRLRLCDVFVMPSIYEGHPKALLEAMALGVPVLAADSPGIREIVQHGSTGFLVPPNADGLRNGLREMFSLPAAERSRLGKTAREWVLSRYSLDRVVSEEIKRIQSVLGN